MKELRERLETVPQRSRLYSRQRAMREDLRSAVRSLRKSPTFTTVAVAVLALGIGAATALYSVVDAVVLRGLPFDEHDRVMAVLEYETTRQGHVVAVAPSAQTYLDWRQQQQAFDGLTATATSTFRLRSERPASRLTRALYESRTSSSGCSASRRNSAVRSRLMTKSTASIAASC